MPWLLREHPLDAGGEYRGIRQGVKAGAFSKINLYGQFISASATVRNTARS